MSFTDYLSKKDVDAESVEQIDERTQEERDAEWKEIKLAIYKESKNLNNAFNHFESLVSKYPTLNAEFKAFKEFYPFSKDLTRQSQTVQNWVSEMEDEAKA